MELPKKLAQKLENREQNQALRSLPMEYCGIDFASNDYIGFSKSETIFEEAHELVVSKNGIINGATGSRLLSGNHPLYKETEDYIANFQKSAAALIFNSGYDANVGFFSAVPQKGDFILYDEYCHASIRDGIQLSNAKAYKFQHNDYEDLQRLLEKLAIECKQSALDNEIYIVTESVFSMDGDCPDFEVILSQSEKHKAYLVVDEAHALGVFGASGEGVIQSQYLQDRIFARIMTFGKGLGCHGAAILGSQELKQYLVNFARSLIYTTALSPHAVATILEAYRHLEKEKNAVGSLRENIVFFNQEKQLRGLKPIFVRSKSAIQSAIIPGNEKVKAIAAKLQQKGFDVKAILAPTVPEGQERLRFCLHSYNTPDQISSLMASLQELL